MRIYIDMRSAQDPAIARSGIGFNTAAVMRNARKYVGPQDELVGIIDRGYPPLPEEFNELLDFQQCCTFPRPTSQPSLFYQPSPLLHDQWGLAPLIGNPNIFNCVQFHDPIPLEYPDFYLGTSFASRKYFKDLIWLNHYRLIFADSQHSADELKKTINVSDIPIEVVGVPVRSTLLTQGRKRIRENRLPCRFPPYSYFLVVGSMGDIRKNVEAAIEALADFTTMTDFRPNLVIVGRYDEAARERLARMSQLIGGPSSAIQFLAGISDSELASLFSHCIATICPSRSEGFSLPVVEALAAGSPVTIANCPAQKELVPDPEYQFDPDDHRKLTSILLKFIESPGARLAALRKQRTIVERFSEEAVSRRLWSAMMTHYEQWRSRVSKRPFRGSFSLPRLAILTPYPPDASGVAYYSEAMIASLSELAEIDVFTDAKTPLMSRHVRQFNPVSEIPYIAGNYDRVLAVAGNSLFHTRIVDYHCRYGGACLAHDSNMAWFYYCTRGPEALAEMMEQALGRTVSTEEIQGWLDEPGALPAMLFDEVLVMADPLIVHSRTTQQLIQEQYGKRAEYLPLGCQSTFTDSMLSPESRMNARRRLGLPPDRIIVVSLGAVHKWRGAVESILALEQLIIRGISADLFFVGSTTHTGEEIAELVERHNLSTRVHMFPQRVSEQEWGDYLLAADLAIQVCKNPFGQISASLLDCICAGLPSIANQSIADALDAPNYVIRVPEIFDPAAIADQAAEMIESRIHETRMSPQRDEYCKKRSSNAYAIQLMKILDLQ